MIRRFKVKSIIPSMVLFISSWVMLSSCATLGKDECLNADWLTIGYEDGARGFAASQIGKHRKACAKHGIAPDFDRYEKGRLVGLQEYCTPQKGYGLGASGKSYTYVCPEDLEKDFQEGYELGKELYGAQMTVNRQKSDLKKMHRDLAAVKQKLNDYETELVRDNGIGPKRRRYLLEEIKILTNEEQVLEAEIIGQEERLEISKRNLHEIRAHNPY